ncbi:MAG: hypothetical protein K6346_02045 [Halothiobacillaceae bacterium]
MSIRTQLISFPREMTQWMLPHGVAAASLSLPEALGVVFTGQLPPDMGWDALSGTTPLDAYKTDLQERVLPGTGKSCH